MVKVNYRHTKRGFLVNLHYEMRHRVDPNSKRQKARDARRKGKSYWAGLPIIERDEFVKWATENPHFNRLFDAWEATGYIQRFVPTVDRVDPTKGYIIGNMEWVMMSENSHRANVSRGKKMKDKDHSVARIAYYTNQAIESISIAKAELNKLVGAM